MNAQLDESKLQYRLVVLQNLLYHEELYVETLELLHQVRVQHNTVHSTPQYDTTMFINFTIIAPSSALLRFPLLCCTVHA